MNETEGIFELLPEGMFANEAELQSAIDEGGIESIYPLLPEGMFADEQEFVNQYSVKKKDGTESVSEDGSSEPVATEDPFERIRNLRPIARLNEEGDRSTVKMADMEVDGKFVAIPTLFPKDPDNYGSAPEDWVEFGEEDAMAAYDMALERGEVFEFDTPEEASDFAGGSWKADTPQKEEDKGRTFEESLNIIKPELIDRGDENQVANELNVEFGDYGFEFESSNYLTDALTVTAQNGNTLKVDLDPWTSNTEVAESQKLRKFLEENKSRSEKAVAREGVEAQYELMALASKEYKEKEAEFLEAERQLKAFLDKNGRELSEEQIAQYNRIYERYQAIGNDMVKSYDNYEAQELVYDMAAGDYEGTYSGEKPTGIEEKLGKNAVTNLIADVGVRAVDKGFAQGGTIRSSNNLMTNANEVTDEEIEEFLRAQQALAEKGNSDEFKAFLQYVKENGGGWGALLKGTKKYPGILPELFVTSAVAMGNTEVMKGALGGGVSFAALAALAGQAGPQLLIPEELVTVPTAFMAGIMGGAGYALESGLSFGEFLNEEMAAKQGVSVEDIDMSVESIREVLGDAEAMDRIRDRANGRGIAIGAMGIVGGAAAAQTTRTVGAALVRMRRPLSILAGGSVGLVSEGAGEAVGRFVAGQDMDKTEIYLESAAMGPITAAGVAYGLAKTPTYTLNKEKVNGRTMARFIREGNDADVAGATIEIKNDKSLLEEARNKRQTAADKNIIRGQLREAGIENEEEIERLAELEMQKRKLKGLETTAAERKRKRIQNEIDAILDGDAYFFEETTDENGRKSTNEVRVTRRDAIMALLQDDIPNPTETEIENKLAELYRDALTDIGRADAIQERETAEVDVEEQSEGGQEVGGEVQTEEEVEIDEEAEALKTQFEAEGTPDVDVTEDDVTIRRREGSPELDRRRRNIIDKAKARAKSLKNFGVNFILHETGAQFDAATGKGNSRGYYDGKNTIHINLENANTRTVAHEAFHAMFLSRVRGGDLDAQAMAIATMQTIRKAVAQDDVLSARIDAFISSYEDNQIDEEALSEIFGYLAEGYGTLSPVQQSGVKAAIVELIYKLTGFELGDRWTEDDQNVLDVFNSLSTKFEKGEEIVEEDIAGLDIDEDKRKRLQEKGLLNNRISEYQKKRRGVQTERDNLISGLIQLANATTDIRATQYLNSLRKKIGVSRLKSLEADMRKVVNNDKLTQQEKEGRLDGLEKKYEQELERIAKAREDAKARIKQETERLKPKAEKRRKKAEKSERISKIKDELKQITAKLSRDKSEAKRNYEGEELKEYIKMLQEEADERRAKLKAEKAELSKKDVLPVIQEEETPVEEAVEEEETPVEEAVEEETAPVEEVPVEEDERIAKERAAIQRLEKKLVQAKQKLKALEERADKERRGRQKSEIEKAKKAIADIEFDIQDRTEYIKELEKELEPTVGTIRTKVGDEKYSALETAVRNLLEYTDEVGEQPTRGQKNALTRRRTKVNKLVAELKLTPAEQAVVQTFVQERVTNKREAEAKMKEERAKNKAAAERAKSADTLRSLEQQLMQAKRELIALEDRGATDSMKAPVKNVIANLEADIAQLTQPKREDDTTVDRTTERKLTDKEIKQEEILDRAYDRLKKARGARSRVSDMHAIVTMLNGFIRFAERAGDKFLVEDLRDVRAKVGRAMNELLDMTEGMSDEQIEALEGRLQKPYYEFLEALKTDNPINAFEKTYVEALGKAGVVLLPSRSTAEASPLLKEVVESNEEIVEINEKLDKLVPSSKEAKALRARQKELMRITTGEAAAEMRQAEAAEERKATERRAPEKRVVKAKPAPKKAPTKKPAAKKPTVDDVAKRAAAEGISVEELTKREAALEFQRKEAFSRQTQRDVKKHQAEVKKLKEELKGKRGKERKPLRDAELRLKEAKEFIDNLNKMSVNEALRLRTPVPSGREQRVESEQVAERRFDLSALRVIGKGSSRVVYDLGDGRALKVAMNPKGLEQNQTLAPWDVESNLDGFVPKVYEEGPDYLVVENLPFDVTLDDGRSGAAVIDSFIYGLSEAFARGPGRLQEYLEEYKEGMGSFVDYEILPGDFKKHDSWGIRKDGTIVLVDEGALNPRVHFGSEPTEWAVEDFSDIEKNRGYRGPRQTLNKYNAENIEYLLSDPNTDVVAEEGNVILYSVVDPSSVVRIMQKGIPSDMNADFSRSRTELGDGGSLVAVEVPADAVSESETGIVSVDGPIPAKAIKKAYDSVRVRRDAYPMREDVFRDELQDRETGEVADWAEEFLAQSFKEGFLYRDSDGLRTGREQRPLEVRELAMRYNINEDGFTISTEVNEENFRRDAARIGLGVKRAASGSLYLTRGGRKINPFKEYEAYSKRVARERKADIKKLQEQTRKREEERDAREEAMRLREEEVKEYQKQYIDFPDEMIPPSELSGREQRESIEDATDGFSVEAVVKFAKERGYKNAAILKVRPDAQQAIEAYDARMDRVNKEIDNIIARVEKRAKTDPIIQGKRNAGLRAAAINQRKLEAVQEYLRGSKVYEEASDVGREAMDIAAMRKAGRKVASSPKPETLLGINQDGNIDKENLKQKIRDMARSSRLTAATMRALMKQLGKDVAELRRGGLLKPVQAAMLLKRMGEVNPFNEVSVERYLQFAERVFMDADYAGDIKAILDNRKRAIKNLGKVGVAPELIPNLSMLLRMNPAMLPDVEVDGVPLVKVVRELTEMLGKRKAVLDLPERSDLSQQVTKILGLIDEELSLKHELFELYEAFPDKQDTVAKTIDAMVDGGVINTEEADILKKYKAELAAEPSEEELAELEKEREEKKKELIQELTELEPLTRRFPLKEENDLVRRFNEATKSKFLTELTNAELTNMLRAADNIANGFVPHTAQVAVEKIASHEKVAIVEENVEGVLPGTLLQLYNKMLEGVGLRDLYKRARRNPTKYFDQVMGNYKSNPVYQAMFRDLGVGYARYNSEMLNIAERLRKLDNLIAKKRGIYKTPNAVARAKFELGAYLMQLEFESNPTQQRGIFSAQELLRATIDKSYQTSGVKYSERQAKMLEGILTKLDALMVEEAELAKKQGREARPLSELMRNGVGNEKPMMSKQQMKVAKGIREIFDELTPKAQYTAGVIRGIPFEGINNYMHRVVQAELDPSDADAGPEAIRMRISKNMQPSTRGKNLTERVTRNAPPVVFDPFVSVNRGARFTLIDYHLTEPVRTARRAQNLLLKGQTDRTARQRQMVNFINDAINFTNENVMGNASSFSDELSRIFEYIKKTGYRQALGSVKRGFAEFNSNFVFSAFLAPEQFIRGMGYRSHMLTNGGAILRNVGSVQTTRLFPESDRALKAGFIDQISDSMNPTGNRARSVARNVAEVIAQNTLGRLRRSADTVADKIITRPDQMINRPLWFGFFADEFKKVSGQEVDFDAIAENNEAYMDANRKAIDEATKKADDMSALAGATDNPYLGVVNALPETKRSAAGKVIQLVDTYMTRFLVFEYAGFRTGVQALIGNGMISPAQGGRLIMAVAARMMLYRLSYDLIRAQISRLYRDDDDEKEINESISDSVKNTALNIAMGTRGQLFRGGVAIGVEGLNEYYHEDLLGEEFQYTDRISMPLIDLQKTDRPYQMGVNTITRLSGPYSPLLKMGMTGLKLMNRSETEAAQTRREIEAKKFLLQAAGIAGLAPMYTDLMYDFQQYEYQIYNPNYGLTEIEKRLKEIEERQKELGLD